MAPLGLRHAAFGAALLILFGSWLPVVVITAALLGAQYWFSDKITLSALRGVEVGPEEEPKLYAILIRLCAQADMPKPALAVAAANEPRAFAGGRGPTRGVLCVTTGLTEQLTDDEIEAVLARELSRLAHRDTAVITLASLMPVLAGLLIRIPMHGAPLGGPYWRTDPALGAGYVALVLAVYALGFLTVRTLARRRELAADRGAALLTGRPSSLARALTKLDGPSGATPLSDLRTLTIADASGSGPAPCRARLFSTYPDPYIRQDRLAQPTRTLETRRRGAARPRI